ncbi:MULTISPECIES: PqqD family protein [unclassified Pseudarthrobacter]|uniref:PqqD family protein n=1 Tax=unclassified Pseudarthrobacter TaxID=2647000 RepID=UPI00363D7DF0
MTSFIVALGVMDNINPRRPTFSEYRRHYLTWGVILTDSSVWIRNCLVAEVRSEHDSRVALLHLEGDQPVVLEGSAAVIWNSIDGAATVEEIVEGTAALYRTNADDVRQSVREFLQDLSANGFIKPYDSGYGQQFSSARRFLDDITYS